YEKPGKDSKAFIKNASQHALCWERYNGRAAQRRPTVPMMTDYFQRFRRFVLGLSGAHLQTLELVPTERARFESLGWAILITSGMAVVSMWFALASAVGINGILAVPIALLWGLVIM